LCWYVPIFYAIKWYGWIYGIAGLIVIWYCFITFARVAFGLEYCNGMDRYLTGDDSRNYCNIIGFMRIEKFNTEAFKN